MAGKVYVGKYLKDSMFSKPTRKVYPITGYEAVEMLERSDPIGYFVPKDIPMLRNFYGQYGYEIQVYDDPKKPVLYAGDCIILIKERRNGTFAFELVTL